MSYRSTSEILAVYKPLITSVHWSCDLANLLLTTPKSIHKNVMNSVTKIYTSDHSGRFNVFQFPNIEKVFDITIRQPEELYTFLTLPKLKLVVISYKTNLEVFP
jgi:hypothetical protein